MSENPFQVMRDQIIEMQRYFADLDQNSKKDKGVRGAVNSLLQTRNALEVLWLRKIRSRG